MERATLSVRQPWATLIVTGRKTVENRSWATSYRGRLWIHAGLRPDTSAFATRCAGEADIDPSQLDLGTIIGSIDLVNIHDTSDSPWWIPGMLAWELASPARLDTPVSCRGMLGIFAVGDAVAKRLGDSTGETANIGVHHDLRS